MVNQSKTKEIHAGRRTYSRSMCRWNEYCVSIVFLLMVVLWLTQEFGDTPGWTIIFPDGYFGFWIIEDIFSPISYRYISDSTVAVFCGLLPLILPNANPFKSTWLKILCSQKFMFHSLGNWTYAPIIQWSDLVKNLAWGVIFLLGAGLAVASAFTVRISFGY